MKKRIILAGLISILSLSLYSCGPTSSTSTLNIDKDTYLVDSRKLLESSPTDFYNKNEYQVPFNLEGLYTESTSNEGKYIVALTISYKDVVLNNLKLILTPYDHGIDKLGRYYSSIGYNYETMNLTPETNKETSSYKGFNLIMNVDITSNLKFKLFVSSTALEEPLIFGIDGLNHKN